ncbi:hypothetical protein HYU08_00635 [Candidatus Woesearchaeota archaeon]|nr:hypothetical protein [Candidatus Woesearchaeota archaeon]
MGIFNLWKKEEAPQLPTAELVAEERKKELEKQSQKDLEDRIKSLDRFPGSLEEYVALKREEGLDYSEIIVPMSTGRSKLFVYDPVFSKNCDDDWMDEGRKILTKLVEEGCIGLIRYQESWPNASSKVAYGIPVKIKNKAPYR